MTAVSIRKVLSMLPSGAAGPPLRDSDLTSYLQMYIRTDAEKERNDNHRIRDDIYRDGGVKYMLGIVQEQFKDLDVQERRKKWVKHARFTNPLKRIVNELSTVYAEPAKRRVADDAANIKYQALLKLLRFDEQMFQISRLLNLHRAVLVAPRVRELPDGTREPVIDIATPANVRCILHPSDDSLVVGWAVRTCMRPVGGPNANTPAWIVWTNAESFAVREDWSIIGDSWQPHSFGVCPWTPVTLGPPQPGFWPGNEGEDLTAATVATWFAGILLLKEMKSATTLPVLQGDGANMARGQAADSETPVELADGQSASTLDMSMDLSMFRDTASYILEACAQDYGMSAALINHQGVQSAEARELMRLPLVEVRRHQQVPLRQFEDRFVVTLSIIIGHDLEDFKFDPSGFTIQFGESQTPLSPEDEQLLFERQRAAGITDTIAFKMMKNPGMTVDQAWAEVIDSIKNEIRRNLLMRPLQQQSGSMGASMPGSPAATATEPGAQPDPVQPDAAPKPVTPLNDRTAFRTGAEIVAQ